MPTEIHKWLCEECFNAVTSGIQCFCCDTLQEEPVDYICTSCAKEFEELSKCAEEGGDVRNVNN